MKNIVLNYKETLIVFICLASLITVSLVSGYFLDPTILGFFFTPIFFILFGLSALVFSGISITRLFKKECRHLNAFINALACASLLVLQFSGSFPSASDGVGYRLQQFSKNDYQVIAAKVEMAYEKFGNNVSHFSRGDTGYKEFLSQLKKEHEIFSISSFPIDVFRSKESVRIEWASGLTGGFEVIIYNTFDLPKWSENYNLVHIYENVAFYYKS